MGFSLTSPAPKKCDPTAENRVWGFFGEPSQTSRENRPQSLQPRQGNSPSPTTIASGRTYWPSRDPIGEDGGINVYRMVGNDVVNRVDYLGQFGWMHNAVDAIDDKLCDGRDWLLKKAGLREEAEEIAKFLNSLPNEDELEDIVRNGEDLLRGEPAALIPLFIDINPLARKAKKIPGVERIVPGRKVKHPRVGRPRAGKKNDDNMRGDNGRANKQVKDAGSQAGLTGEQARKFSEFSHKCKKKAGRGGADNYSYSQILEAAKKFKQGKRVCP